MAGGRVGAGKGRVRPWAREQPRGTFALREVFLVACPDLFAGQTETLSTDHQRSETRRSSPWGGAIRFGGAGRARPAWKAERRYPLPLRRTRPGGVGLFMEQPMEHEVEETLWSLYG